MMQFVWLYVRAWVWVRLRLLGWPRLGPATGAWLALALISWLSQHLQRELWPHTPAAAGWSMAGLIGSLGTAAALLLRDLWRWWWAWQPALWHWAVAVLVLGPLAGLSLMALVLVYAWLLA